MGDKHLSEVICYEKDIAPFSFIQIFSGVGSGKNYFINQLINGYTETRPDKSTYNVPPHRVLCITSRRAKVDETSSDENVSVGTYVDEWIHGCQVDDINEYLDSHIILEDTSDWGMQSLHQRSIVCTNAAIEKYLEKHYNPIDVTTHLWRRFDIIVLDEAHSVLADASYQSAPFYTHKLVNEVIKRNKKGETNCKAIIMTGTSHIIENFSIPSGAREINAMNECINVAPSHIAFINSNDARTILLSQFANGQKAVYFANHIATLFSLRDEIPSAGRDRIALSFTKEERLDLSNEEHTTIAIQMHSTQEYIAKEQRLPNNIQLFITTSRNKEGINLLNNDIKIMFVEAHSEVDIIQMAGRVRYGLDILYVVTDSAKHIDTESEWEYDFTKEESLAAHSNNYFQEICRHNDIDLSSQDIFVRKSVSSYPKLSGFIDYIHVKFPYLRFNYLTDQFELYSNRKKSKKYYQEQETIFNEAKRSSEGLCALAQTWFPGVEVSFVDLKRDKIVEYLTLNNLINVPLDKSQLDQIRKDIAVILNKEFKSLGHTLQPYGFKVEKVSGNKSSKNYNKRKIVSC